MLYANINNKILHSTAYYNINEAKAKKIVFCDFYFKAKTNQKTKKLKKNTDLLLTNPQKYGTMFTINDGVVWACDTVLYNMCKSTLYNLLQLQ